MTDVILNFAKTLLPILKKRICLWSSPRNISTALMYSFGQRSDTVIVDEPLYGHYLRVTGAMHPGREEIIESMETNGEIVIRDVILGDFLKNVLFMKQMTHHLVDIDHSFLNKVTNVLLIRDPKQLISSFHEVIPEVRMTDIGIEKQFRLFNELCEAGAQPVVIDSGEILKSPEVALNRLCDELKIDFEEEMLSWDPGPRKEDGVWAKHWYMNVHRSTGFEVQATSSRKLPDHLTELYEDCIPYYQHLFEHSIKV